MDFASTLNSKEQHPNRQWVGRLKTRTELSPGLFEITIELTEVGFRFLAGQYIWLLLPSLKNNERRAFSLINAEGPVKELTILVRESKSQYKQQLLEQKLGTSVIILGPHGSSFQIKKDDKHLVLLANGTGIAPFVSLARSHSTSTQHPRLDIVYVSKDENIAYENELKEISKSSNNVAISIFRSRRAWDSHKDQVKLLKNTRYLTSGTQEFVDDTSDLLDSIGVNQASQIYEEYRPSKSTNTELSNVVESISLRDKNVDQVGSYTDVYQRSRQKVLTKSMGALFLLYIAVVMSSVVAYILTSLTSEAHHVVAIPAYTTAFLYIGFTYLYWRLKKNPKITGLLIMSSAILVILGAISTDLQLVTSYLWATIPLLFFYLFLPSKKATKSCVTIFHIRAGHSSGCIHSTERINWFNHRFHPSKLS